MSQERVAEGGWGGVGMGGRKGRVGGSENRTRKGGIGGEKERGKMNDNQ